MKRCSKKIAKMKYTLLIITLAICGGVQAQCKTFKIGVKGDTLNCTDYKDLKQGKWVVSSGPLRGEPGFDEEGVFKDGKKDGVWRTYSLEGDIIAIESFRYGYKNGICQYYNIAGLQRQESWRAVNPDHPYDTIKVYDVKNPDMFEMKEIKVEGSTYKQGTWKYYDPASGIVLKTEEYVLNKLQSPLVKSVAADTSATAATKPKETKPAAVLEYEKKNAKKKIKVRDGATGF